MESYLEIKKSKFYAYTKNIHQVQEVGNFIDEIKLKHKKPTHICYAYIIIENGVQKEKFFDAGEPNGTAGKPILEVLRKKKLNDIICVVVRYFGGIKLGAGGLVRAYTNVTSKALMVNDENN